MSSNVGSMNSQTAIPPSSNGTAFGQKPYADLGTIGLDSIALKGSAQNSSHKAAWITAIGGIGLVLGGIFFRKNITAWFKKPVEEGVTAAAQLPALNEKQTATHAVLHEKLKNGSSWEDIKKEPQFAEASQDHLFAEAVNLHNPKLTPKPTLHNNLLMDMLKDQAETPEKQQKLLEQALTSEHIDLNKFKDTLSPHFPTFDPNASSNGQTIFERLVKGKQYDKAQWLTTHKDFDAKASKTKSVLTTHKNTLKKEDDLVTAQTTAEEAHEAAKVELDEAKDKFNTALAEFNSQHGKTLTRGSLTVDKLNAYTGYKKANLATALTKLDTAEKALKTRQESVELAQKALEKRREFDHNSTFTGFIEATESQ
jgi:hypothetical protein